MAAKNPQIDPNDHYVLIGTRKDTGEQEPVHPGSVTLTEAKRVQRVLAPLSCRTPATRQMPRR